MMAIEESRLDETVFYDPHWIAASGGWLHSNNVLFYFAQSPFFDRQSNNQSVFSQSVGNPSLEPFLNTRQTFEERLAERPGIEYVVAHDPLETNTFVDGPDGPVQSNVWIIRKQERTKGSYRDGKLEEDGIMPLANYHIVNQAIYQSPSLLKILTNRMATTVTSLTKMISAGKDLASFAPAYGHTYFPPVSKAQDLSKTGFLQQSKENTPMPESQGLKDNHAGKTSSEQQPSAASDTRTLIEAMAMSVRHRGEYVDDAPLVGEPGNFRLSSKKKDTLSVPGLQAPVNSRQATPAKDNTTIPSRAPSPPPAIQTDVPAVKSKKSSANEKTPTTPGGTPAPKTKRRKSKIGSTPGAS
jgi:mediator of RNA polymerase II transcription subunit 6